jgi:hypothetical protein
MPAAPAHRPAEEIEHAAPERPALQIPERDVEGRHGIGGRRRYSRTTGQACSDARALPRLWVLPIRLGAMPSMIALTAKFASGNWVMISPSRPARHPP